MRGSAHRGVKLPSSQTDKTETNSVEKTTKANSHAILKKTLSTPSATQPIDQTLQVYPREQSKSSEDLRTPYITKPGTQDAPLNSLRSNLSVSAAGIQSSDDSSIPLQSHDSRDYYKIKYDEVYALNHSLIDKISEKEKIIWELEKTVNDLRGKIKHLESSKRNERSNPGPSVVTTIEEDLGEQKILVSSLLSTVRTLEAELKTKNTGLSKSQPHPLLPNKMMFFQLNPLHQNRK
ncbi:hypothetical protein WDU94_015618 [Cyamophila willieti]